MEKTNKKTVLIRLNKNCYVTVDKKCYGGTHKVSQEGEKIIREWIGEEVWVTPTEADNYTSGDRPVARIIKTRTTEEIKKEDEDTVTSSKNLLN